MTAEEIEIIVTAKVEEALKEFKKIVPTIKEQLKQVQESFSKVNVKNMQDKVQQAVQIMKKRLQDFRKSNTNNEVAIKVNNKDAKKQISQIQKQIDSLQEKINARQMKLNVINPQIDKIVYDTRKSVTPEGINPNDKAMDTTVNNALESNKDFTSLNSQAQKLYTEIEMYNKKLSETKNKMAQLKQETNKTATTQNKLSSFFGMFKQKLEQAKPSVTSIKNSFKGLPKITQNITNNVQGMGKSIKQGLGHVLRYALALFSLRGIYSILSNCASSWLSSQNAGAKQLSANIEYMKYAMGSALAPIIQFVTNLVYQLMKAIQSVAYALTGVNIFANASAKSYEKMAGSAKKAKNETKQLTGVHNEINNISNSNGNSDSGNGNTSPSFDLSGIDSQMSPLAQKLYNFFKPLVDSWNIYGAQVISALKNAIDGIGQAISAMWSSVETLFTNGTIYSIIANILNSIGQVGVAWANAWNNGNNGTEIIQGIANMINDITNAILNLVSSTGFQSFLDGVLSTISGIVQFIEPILDGCTEMSEKILEIVLSGIGKVLKTVGDALQIIVQNKTVSDVLKAVGEAIAIVVGAIALWNVAQAILNGLMGVFAVLTSPISLIILGIVAAITSIILVIKNWGTVSEWFQNLWKNITKKIQEIWNGMLNVAKTIFNNLKNNIGTKFKETVSKIKDNFKISTIKSHFKNVVSTIKSVFSSIPDWFKDKFSKAWNNVKNVFSKGGKVFSGIKDGIASTFKKIVNSLITGINKVIKVPFDKINSALNTIKNVNILGARPFSGLPTINVPQIPKLAKGNVAYEKTLAIFGEYSGASNNPEITAPKNVMYETMRSALDDADLGNNNDRPIYLTVNVGNQRLGQILLDELRDKRRRTGKGIEALVGG